MREAVARRHAYVTVEHLLYALLHDDGRHRRAAQLRAPGSIASSAELERFFDEDLEQVPGDDAVEARQTLAFHRVLQHALDHTASAEKEEVEAGDLLAAIFQEPDSHAVTLLRAQGVTPPRRAPVHLPRHLQGGERRRRRRARGLQGRSAGGEEAGEIPADPLQAFSTNLTARAAEGQLDPLIGRAAELERIIHILARRRKNNPIFVGETGVGKTALAEGLALRIHEGRVPEDLEGRGDLLPRPRRPAGRHALPRRFRGALQGADRTSC